jgi:hypothetical protein
LLEVGILQEFPLFRKDYAEGYFVLSSRDSGRGTARAAACTFRRPAEARTTLFRKNAAWLIEPTATRRWRRVEHAMARAVLPHDDPFNDLRLVGDT